MDRAKSPPHPGSPARSTASRIIFHVDMDAFYATVEERDNPELIGHPVVIGADPKNGTGRGVVSTCNYEARSFGLHSAMPISEAYRLCPHAKFVRPSFDKYKEASQSVMAIFEEYADILEVVGMDEAYLDVSAKSELNWKTATSLALSLQAAVARNTGLSCSVGVAPNKSIAKVASDWRKPHGVTVVEPDQVQSFLRDLPVRLLHGCGPKMTQALEELGFQCAGEVASSSRELLESELGSSGAWIWDIASGHDVRPVTASRGPRKSQGNESTFMEDVLDSRRVQKRAHKLLTGLLEGAAKEGRPFATLTVKVRYRGFRTVTRANSFSVPIDPRDAGTEEICAMVVEQLLDGLLDGSPIRLVGVRLSNFSDIGGQRSLRNWGMPTTRPSRRVQAQRVIAPWKGQQILSC